MSFAMCYIVIISEQSHSLCHFSYVQIMMIYAQNLSSYVLLYSHSLFVVSKGLLISFLQLYILLGFVPLISINQITLIRIKSDCIDFLAAVVYEILSLPFFFCTS